MSKCITSPLTFIYAKISLSDKRRGRYMIVTLRYPMMSWCFWPPRLCILFYYDSKIYGWSLSYHLIFLQKLSFSLVPRLAAKIERQREQFYIYDKVRIIMVCVVLLAVIYAAQVLIMLQLQPILYNNTIISGYYFIEYAGWGMISWYSFSVTLLICSTCA